MNNQYTIPFIDVALSEAITNRICSKIVNSIIKFLVYQRLQIPFTYDRLRFVVTRKIESEGKKGPYISEHYFKIASTALNSLDKIFETLSSELEGDCPPKEICILLGTNPMTSKEVYRIVLPDSYNEMPVHQNEKDSDNKLNRIILKLIMSIITADDLQSQIYGQIGLTNMFVLVRKCLPTPDHEMPRNFTFLKNLRFSKKVKLATINLRPRAVDCSKNFNIFQDDTDSTSRNESTTGTEKCSGDDPYYLESSENSKWFTSSIMLKGFKDCCMNGVSVTDLWVKL